MKSKVRWVALVTLAVLSLEGFSYLGLHLLSIVKGIRYVPLSLTSIPNEHRTELEDFIAGRTNFIAHSAALGWTIKPNGFSPPLYRANSKGLRANREYAPVPQPNVTRISSFGDSFTMGADVGNDATWQEGLARFSRSLEVLNFGVSGFGLDQAFLRYRHDGLPYRSHIVLIGILTESIFRSANVCRSFYSPESAPVAKPRFILDGDELLLQENPLRELSRYKEFFTNPEPVYRQLAVHDYYVKFRYTKGPLDFLRSVRLFKVARSRLAIHRSMFKNQYFDTTSEPYRVTVAILDLFVATASSNGSIPIILLFPQQPDLEQYRGNRTTRTLPLLEHLRRKGYRYVDLAEGFERYASEKTVEDLVSGHYTPVGNEIVARSIWDYLVAHRLVDLESRR